MAGNQTVQSVERALDLLQAAAGRSEGLALAELCEHSGLKTTTAHNLIRTLVARGFLAKRSAPTRYRLGPAAFELVDHQHSAALQKHAVAVLRALSERFPDGTVTLAVPRDLQMAISLRLSPHRGHQIEHPTDRRMHPYVSASAMIHLAYADAGDRASHARQFPFEEHAGHVWPDRATFEKALDQTQKRGIAVLADRDAILPIAAPVWREGQLVAALGLALPRPISAKAVRALANEAATVVTAFAKELTQTLESAGH